jgi:rhodanese-related sulfurtransferase
MDLIKKYKVVIAIVLIILILVLIRSLGANHFKSDAKRWAESSVIQSNIITGDRIGTLSGEKLIINLSEEGSGINEMTRNALHIPADSLFSKNNLNAIRKHDGPVLLFSSETAVSARIWMLLSQMGYKNVFILTNVIDNEVFKHKFRPDTSVRPEL